MLLLRNAVLTAQKSLLILAKCPFGSCHNGIGVNCPTLGYKFAPLAPLFTRISSISLIESGSHREDRLNRRTLLQ